MHKKQIRPLACLHGYWVCQTLLSRTARWSLEQRNSFIFQRLKRTLVLAEGTPFYRDRFREAGFDPHRHFQQVEDLARLPLLTKDDVRARSDDMIDRRFLTGSVVANTSGTTGQPMAMRLNESYIALDYACMFRFWAQAGYTFRARFAAIRSYVPSSVSEPFWKYNWWQNTLYLSAYHLKPSNAADYIEALLRFKPAYLRGYASSVNTLAEYAYPHREKLAFLRGVFTASEMLLPAERVRIERTFGRKLFDWYGMTEPAVVITERADHDGMEVNWEYGFPEFLESSELGADERKLVATSLHNPVMPFIRYETGDSVKLAGIEPEPREVYPRVLAISGRKDDCLLTPDGARLPSLNFYSLLQTYTDILRFQFVQASLREVTMKVLLRPTAKNPESLMMELRGEVSRRLGPETRLTIEVTDQFSRSPDGKTPTFQRTFTALSSPSVQPSAQMAGS
jgi:phenylacetate-CoA ligase